VCWSTKAAISLKHVKIGEELLWRAYRNSPTLFRMVPTPTPYDCLFSKIQGSQPPSKTPIAIISGMCKATDFKFGQNVHRVHSNKSPLNILEKGVWAYPESAQIFWVPPIISGTGTAMNFKFGHNILRVHPNKSPLKILQKREGRHIRGLPKFFWVSPIISGTGKATNFKFCRHIHSINQKKSPLKILGDCGHSQGLQKIFRALFLLCNVTLQFYDFNSCIIIIIIIDSASA